MVEQRYQAVREVLDTGATITDVAARYGVDRRTLRRCLTKYPNGGLEAQATRPDTRPHQMDPVIEAGLVLPRSRPRWRPRTLWSKLRPFTRDVVGQRGQVRCRGLPDENYSSSSQVLAERFRSRRRGANLGESSRLDVEGRV
jgi:hypothetical protein